MLEVSFQSVWPQQHPSFFAVYIGKSVEITLLGPRILLVAEHAGLLPGFSASIFLIAKLSSEALM